MKRAATIVAVLALMSPMHLGEAAATNDTAVFIGIRKPIDVRTDVQARASRSGWRGAQWRCIDALVYRESRWHPTSKNAHSSAYGLFQFLRMKPGTSVERQYQAFERYIASRYHGNPCNALHFHNLNGYY
jgi:hypothetical protein